MENFFGSLSHNVEYFPCNIWCVTSLVLAWNRKFQSVTFCLFYQQWNRQKHLFLFKLQKEHCTFTYTASASLFSNFAFLFTSFYPHLFLSMMQAAKQADIYLSSVCEINVARVSTSLVPFRFLWLSLCVPVRHSNDAELAGLVVVDQPLSDTKRNSQMTVLCFVFHPQEVWKSSVEIIKTYVKMLRWMSVTWLISRHHRLQRQHVTPTRVALKERPSRQSSLCCI